MIELPPPLRDAEKITWDLHDLGSVKSKKIFGKSTAYQLVGMISFHEDSYTPENNFTTNRERGT